MATHVWHHATPSRLNVSAPTSHRVEAVLFDAGRIIFASFFLYSGLMHLVQAPAMAPYAAANGVPFPELAVIGTGVLLIAGSVCLLTRWPRTGAAMIMLFLVGVTPVMHAFWNDPAGPARVADLGNFTKNVALFAAACMCAGLPEPWPTLFGRRPETDEQ